MPPRKEPPTAGWEGRYWLGDDGLEVFDMEAVREIARRFDDPDPDRLKRRLESIGNVYRINKANVDDFPRMADIKKALQMVRDQARDLSNLLDKLDSISENWLWTPCEPPMDRMMDPDFTETKFGQTIERIQIDDKSVARWSTSSQAIRIPHIRGPVRTGLAQHYRRPGRWQRETGAHRAHDLVHHGRRRVSQCPEGEAGSIYRNLIKPHYPAMAVLEVAALIEKGKKLEIETAAIIPNTD